MKSRLLLSLTLPAFALLLPASLTSCASDDVQENEFDNPRLQRQIDERGGSRRGLQDRLDSRNEFYYRSIDRRAMRRKARDERYDAWFDMIMQ